MTGRGHGSHVVARLRPSERRPPRRLSDGERLVVHPVHDEITATANRQGGRPPLTMMVYGPTSDEEVGRPTHRPFIHQSGCRLISPASSSESRPEIMSAFSLREARADIVLAHGDGINSIAISTIGLPKSAFQNIQMVSNVLKFVALGPSNHVGGHRRSKSLPIDPRTPNPNFGVGYKMKLILWDTFPATAVHGQTLPQRSIRADIQMWSCSPHMSPSWDAIFRPSPVSSGALPRVER